MEVRRIGSTYRLISGGGWDLTTHTRRFDVLQDEGSV